jgi:hypothetical protein
MAWRLARSLVVLRNQINAVAPNRSRRSDGTIGDASHAARCSRHNPNRSGVVTALDITHDPARGCDIHAIAEHIRRHPHPELNYLISRSRIAGRSTGWAWHRYTGSNPHNVHVHFGMGVGSDCSPQPPYDSTVPWNIGKDEMDIADLRRELTTGGTPTRSAIRDLARLGTRDALTTGGDPARTAILDLVRRAITEDDETRAAVIALVRRAIREEED